MLTFPIQLHHDKHVFTIALLLRVPPRSDVFAGTPSAGIAVVRVGKVVQEFELRADETMESLVTHVRTWWDNRVSKPIARGGDIRYVVPGFKPRTRKPEAR